MRRPFVWYIDEIDREFKNKLIRQGFKDGGIFQGVIGLLNKAFSVELPKDCLFEMVSNEQAMDEFNELLSSTFDMKGASKEFYKKVMWKATQSNQMYHWLARKEDKVISVMSTLIDGSCVSFWNAATKLEFRRQGINTALIRLALNDAISKGCVTGISYLMSEGLASGICKKLGYQTKWRFQPLIAPN